MQDWRGSSRQQDMLPGLRYHIMAGNARARSEMVDHNKFSSKRLPLGVTPRARYAFMPAFQWKRRARVMIELRRFPDPGLVALGALAASSLATELATVDVIVAGAALGGRSGECRFAQRLRRIRGLVAVRAVHCTVSTEQRKARLRVVESGYVLPILDGVAEGAGNR